MATTGTFDVGDAVRVTAEFRDFSAALIDPDTVVFKSLDPGGIVNTPSVTHISTGRYSADFIATAPGTWAWRWQATGNITVAEEGQVTVRTSLFP
jgi:hypothetical protein